MGFFSGKKTVNVSSVVYNLAGDINDRAYFLRTTVVGTVLADNGSYMGETLTRAYQGGPGLRFRTFSKWAQSSGYNSAVGLSTGYVGTNANINLIALAAIIPKEPTESLKVKSSLIGSADYSYWAEEYMMQNYPDLLDTEWIADFDADTGIIKITFVDETFVEFTPDNFDSNAQYLYVLYQKAAASRDEPLVPGDTVTLPTGAPFPSTAGYTRISNSSTPKTLALNTHRHTVVSYSDGRPDEVSDQDFLTTGNYTETHAVWQKTVFMGEHPDDTSQLYSIRSTMYLDQVGTVNSTESTTSSSETIAGGVVKTTTVTNTVETVLLVRTYRIDTQEIINTEWGQVEYIIYKQGDGNVDYDLMFSSSINMGAFLPFIPIRIDNKFISDSYLPSIYELNKKAYRRALDGRYTKIVDTIGDNTSIGDIDYAYVSFGVSLNVKEVACRKYLYLFFRNLSASNPGTYAAYERYILDFASAKATQDAWIEWKQAQTDTGNPLFGRPEPATKPYPVLPTATLQFASSASWVNYNMSMTWNSIRETVGSGLGRPGAKKNDIWVTYDGSDNFTENYLYGTDGGEALASNVKNVSHVSFWWQDGTNTFRRMRVSGLNHRNLIYGGKSVEITAQEALADSEESGFLIPLHDATFRNMGMKDSTQMGTACAYVVFNCYTVTKQKWYQTGVFKIIVIIIIIIISVYSGGSGAGLLGTNAGVGAGLGFSGTAALVAGAIANAVAAMIVMNVMTAGAKALFGDKIGSIVGTIAGVIAVSYGSAYMNGQEMSGVFGNMMKAENLMKLTASVGNGISQYMQAAARETVAATVELLAKYESEAKSITDAYAQNLANTGVSLDPMRMTDVNISTALETSESFLSRTLMTGSDIVEMSHSMLTNFTSLTLSTQQPI